MKLIPQMIKRSLVSLVLFTSVMLNMSTSAQTLQELQEQLHTLRQELNELKGGGGIDGDQLDPSLDALIKRGKGLSLRFYGESKYNFSRGSNGNYFDPHRFVLIPQYRINDWINFNSELELAHGGVDDSDGGRFDGELELEQIYADVQAWGDRENNWLTWRSLGVSLIPVGSVNLVHEPDTFYSVHRPIMYKYIIPSSWMEGSTGFLGDVPGVEGLSWQFLISTGLSTQNGTIQDASKGVRSTRPNLRAKGDNNQLAYTFRLEYEAPVGSLLDGFSGSTSTYISDYREQNTPANTSAVLWDIEGKYEFKSGFLKDFELIADYAQWNFGSPDAIADANVGNRMYGYRMEMAYHYRYGTKQEIVPYFRFEGYDTSDGSKDNNSFVETGSSNYLSYGVSWFLDPAFVVKAGMRQSLDNNSNSEFSIGVGYNF